MAPSKKKTPYIALQKDRARGVELPDFIKCKICKNAKPRVQYSNKQLMDVKMQVFEHESGVKDAAKTLLLAMCRSCTDQTLEMHCIVCTEYKPLDEFAKAQRKTPDEAKCIVCMASLLSLEPDEVPPEDEDKNDEGRHDSDDDDDDEDDDDDTISNPYEFDDLSTVGELRDDYETESVASSRGGVTVPSSAVSIADTEASKWVEQKGRRWQASSKKGSVVGHGSYNPSAYQSSRASSVISSLDKREEPEAAAGKKWAKPPRGGTNKATQPELPELDEFSDEYDYDYDSAMPAGWKGKDEAGGYESDSSL